MKRIIIFAVVLFVAVNFNAEAKRHHHGVGGYFYTELAHTDHGLKLITE
ncbi:MAG: hypothetical protein MUE93_01730 [Ignavibacteriaceae bacterium]|nr:hypothetical protein [Ignavibacteriaceae bacterium]